MYVEVCRSIYLVSGCNTQEKSYARTVPSISTIIKIGFRFPDIRVCVRSAVVVSRRAFPECDLPHQPWQKYLPS